MHKKHNYYVCAIDILCYTCYDAKRKEHSKYKRKANNIMTTIMEKSTETANPFVDNASLWTDLEGLKGDQVETTPPRKIMKLNHR